MTENQRMDLILQKLGGIEGGLASVGEDVRLLQGGVQSLEEDVQTLKEDVQSLKERIASIEIILENETNRNIQLVTEGRLNLDRKLDGTLEGLHPNTMYHLEVNHLNGKVTKMKRILNMV